jgi:hypothetical protein
MRKNELANEIARFSSVIIFLFKNFNELTIKCVVTFGGFMKFSKDPWQLMVEIGLLNFLFMKLK